MGTKTPRILKQHAQNRAFDHYQLRLSEMDVAVMARMIRNGKSIYVDKASNRVTLHLVESYGMTLPVVYDKQRKCIVTILPPQKRDEWLARKDVQQRINENGGAICQTGATTN